jgi:hypothetical protein
MLMTCVAFGEYSLMVIHPLDESNASVQCTHTSLGGIFMILLLGALSCYQLGVLRMKRF